MINDALFWTVFLVYPLYNAYAILSIIGKKNWGRMGVIYGQWSRAVKGKIGAEYVKAYLEPKNHLL